MLIIGEKIHATRKKIAAALAAKDADRIIKATIEQVRAGGVQGGLPGLPSRFRRPSWPAC